MSLENTIAQARDFYRNLDKHRPDLTQAKQVPNRLRGVDVYSETNFFQMLTNAIAVFKNTHGRVPDLIHPKKSADHFFAMKLFASLQPKPNPASKLNAALYLPKKFKSKVYIPKRHWVSDKPFLPPNNAVRAGKYYLKLDLGNATNLPVSWPPSPEERMELSKLTLKWFSRTYGVGGGEWWYGISPQRVFLEESLSRQMLSPQDVKFFVRNGKVKLFYTELNKSLNAEKDYHMSFFDGDCNPVMGVDKGHTQMKHLLPERIKIMLEVAAAIGHQFDLVRVDFFDAGDRKPILGELSFCHANANASFIPKSLDDMIRINLFE